MPERPSVKLPLRLRTLVGGEASVDAPMVHCPRQGKSVDALRCMGCARMRTMEWEPEQGGTIECAGAEMAPQPRAKARRASLGETAARVQLHEVVEAVTVCVPAEAKHASFRGLIVANGLRALPVVDASFGLLGVVFPEDLVDAPDDARADALMRTRTHALPEHAPPGHAIALMGFDGVDVVPVVTEGGYILGLWHARDALRWIALQMGYVSREPSTA